MMHDDDNHSNVEATLWQFNPPTQENFSHWAKLVLVSLPVIVAQALVLLLWACDLPARPVRALMSCWVVWTAIRILVFVTWSVTMGLYALPLLADSEDTEQVQEQDGEDTEQVQEQDGEDTEQEQEEEQEDMEQVQEEDGGDTEQVQEEDEEDTEQVQEEDEEDTEQVKEQDEEDMEQVKEQEQEDTEQVQEQDGEETEQVQEQDGEETEQVQEQAQQDQSQENDYLGNSVGAALLAGDATRLLGYPNMRE